ncbi:MAG: single-stranded DNA-binding protein [Gemmatimonadetes bacterium]|nr:single-stranded DNA-binding protein [Gemmatimonadota bacterium]
MSRSLNKVMLIGHVGDDPEIRSTPNGNTLAKFSVATSRTWKDKDGQQQEKTEWHRCTAWGKLADIIGMYVKKGKQLYVEGSVEYSQTENDGQIRYWTDINVRDMQMLGSRSDEGSWTSPPEESPEPPKSNSEPDDDLPF